MKSHGLGRGLSALIDSKNTQKQVPVQPTGTDTKTDRQRSTPAKYHKSKSNQDILVYINISSISPNPYQPRKEFDEIAIQELASAISRSGFITPILVTKSSSGYTLVAGERRLRACKVLGLAEIPAIIKDLSDAQMMQIAIIENVQRKELNPIEEAQAYDNMFKKLKISSNELSDMLGLSKIYVEQKMKLLLLPQQVQDYVVKEELSESASFPLLRLHSHEAMNAAAKIAVRQKMSRKAVENLVEKILLSQGIKPQTNEYRYRSRFQHMIDAFKDNLDWDMKIKSGNGGSGKIEINFDDELQLQEIYKALEKVLN
jgi:ParB family transcriptional regulator, chromosome partitioning protein